MSGQKKLSPRFEKLLRLALSRFAPGATPEQLATSVKKLSDYYLIAPGSPTPWDKDFAVSATLAYFMPLNGVRMSAVMEELRRFIRRRPFQKFGILAADSEQRSGFWKIKSGWCRVPSMPSKFPAKLRACMTNFKGKVIGSRKPARKPHRLRARSQFFLILF